MNRHFLQWAIALSTFVPGQAPAQTASFEWARLLTGYGNRDFVWTAALDAEGDLLASFMRRDAPAASYWASHLLMKIETQSGEVVWTNDKLPSRRTGLAVAQDGSVYVAGSLAYLNDSDGASLGGPQGYFANRGITTAGTGGAYLAKLSPFDGTIQSILHFGSSLYVMPIHLRIAPDGDLRVAGIYMHASAQFGETSLPAPATATAKNFFLSRISPAGEIRWAEAMANAHPTLGLTTGMAVDASGNVVFGGWSPGDFSMQGQALKADNGFAIKLSPQGEVIWTKERIGYNTAEHTFHIDGQDNIYFPGTPDGLQKYSPAGDLLWSRPRIGSLFVEQQGRALPERLPARNELFHCQHCRA